MSKYTNNVSRSIVETLEGRRMMNGAVNFDLDRNGEVNGDDFQIIGINMNQEVSGWANGDLDGTGTVDEADLHLMETVYNATGDASSLVLLPGDANGDGEVTDGDLISSNDDTNFDGVVDALETWEALQPSNLPGEWSDGDFTGDGVVDQADFDLFQGVKQINASTKDGVDGLDILVIKASTDGVIDGDEYYAIDTVNAYTAALDEVITQAEEDGNIDGDEYHTIDSMKATLAAMTAEFLGA